MEQVYLPGEIRERIQDLMKSRKVTQAEFATRIGVSESSLSRFISGKTDKLGDENIIRIRSLTCVLQHHLNPNRRILLMADLWFCVSTESACSAAAVK